MRRIASQQKGSSKKREREQVLKSKRGETSYEEAPCYRKREDEIYRLMGEILSKERQNGDHIFL
jgi:hypothetical protein